ncbi:hypothetical protein [Agromyces larvae]|uniref:hypothetical protein n=1 Tax=Agromyces larvae TaxID=2929802 RepID=UPI003F49A98C
MASTLGEPQAQVDQFDLVYNTECPHQGPPGQVTPQQAWDATPVADPPRPLHSPPRLLHPSPPPAHCCRRTPDA